MSTTQGPLQFRGAPHIIQDFGINLYSDLTRVLVEYVANAYDADAIYADVLINKEEIGKQRKLVKKNCELAKAKADAAGQANSIRPLLILAR